MFDNIITSEFKNLFTDAIDSLLAENSLSVPCKLFYSGEANSKLCSNCEYDTISKLSANIYKSGGPVPFTNGHICPVCMGVGYITSDSSEIIHMAVIFDSKFFVNWSTKAVDIPAGIVQTICDIKYMSKIKNANEVSFDTNLSQYGNAIYARAGDPTPVGLGINKYITTIWNRQ